MQPTVLLDGQCMLFSFTLAVMSHVCSTMAMSAFTTFCKADEDIKRDPFLWSVYWSASTLRINSLHILFFLFGDGLFAYLSVSPNEKKRTIICMFALDSFFLRLYRFSATIGVKYF